MSGSRLIKKLRSNKVVNTHKYQYKPQSNEMEWFSIQFALNIQEHQEQYEKGSYKGVCVFVLFSYTELYRKIPLIYVSSCVLRQWNRATRKRIELHRFVGVVPRIFFQPSHMSLTRRIRTRLYLSASVRVDSSSNPVRPVSIQGSWVSSSSMTRSDY